MPRVLCTAVTLQQSLQSSPWSCSGSWGAQDSKTSSARPCRARGKKQEPSVVSLSFPLGQACVSPAQGIEGLSKGCHDVPVPTVSGPQEETAPGAWGPGELCPRAVPERAAVPGCARVFAAVPGLRAHVLLCTGHGGCWAQLWAQRHGHMQPHAPATESRR